MKKVLFFLLLASCANAGWTPAEKVELEKLILSKVEIGDVWQQTGARMQFPPMDESNRQLFANALWETVEASFWCGDAFANFNGDRGNDTGLPLVSRAQYIADAKDSIGSCVTNLSQAIGDYTILADTTGDGFLASARDMLQVIHDRMVTFDTTLPFLDPSPPAFPRIVGSHGDFQTSQRFLTRSHLYFHHTMADATQFFMHAEVWPASANQPFNVFWASAEKALQTHTRAWGLDSDIILDIDETVIQFDTDAGSGLRGFDFFRLSREIELIFGFPQNRWDILLHSGRRGDTGFGTHLRPLGQNFSAVHRELVMVNSITEIREWWTPAPGSVLQFTGVGRAVEFWEDFPDGWADGDGWGQAAFGFFHEIPLPPGGPPLPPECPSFIPSPNVVIDGIPVVCVEVP